MREFPLRLYSEKNDIKSRINNIRPYICYKTTPYATFTMKKLIALLVIGGMFIFVSMECALTKNTQSVVNPKENLSKVQVITTQTEQPSTTITDKPVITTDQFEEEEELENYLAD